MASGYADAGRDPSADDLAKQEAEHAHAGDDVQRVQSRHAEVEREEHLDARARGAPEERAHAAGVDAFAEVLERTPSP